jgi:hypothetical protein
MMITSGVERPDMPQGAEACVRASVGLVANAFWSRHITRTTCAIKSAPSGVRPILRTALAV